MGVNSKNINPENIELIDKVECEKCGKLVYKNTYKNHLDSHKEVQEMK